MSKAGQIVSISPGAGVAGGEFVIEGDFDSNDPTVFTVWVDDVRAPLVALSPRRVIAVVPEIKKSGAVDVRVEASEQEGEPARFIVGKKLAEDLHPVTNPAFDPDDKSLFVTRSGSRGERLPVSLFRVDAAGEVSEFSGDIPNPTAIAFDDTGQMFVSSRFDGTIYRISAFREAQPFARNLGIATGVAFARNGTMHVGDRTGTIYQVNSIGEEKPWAQLEPSVSAYHLAFGPDDALYVTGPTVSSFDSIYRIDRDGAVDTFFKGLGRPQGLAFDSSGNLYVTASFKGRRGVVRIAPNGKDAELVVAGMNLVGLAFGPNGDLVVASIEAVFSLPLGIAGTLL
ncbi:MAG: gluconolaconase [Acidobacteriota bacterium]|nr:gluconolaconase [Acidobacteriota bacterium]